MAVRERKGRASPWQTYWNNPITGKRECANFATKEEALKHDSLIKHRLKFERESFRPVEEEKEEEQVTEITLEQAYFLYLKEKQFSKKSLAWQLDAMRLVLSLYGKHPLASIGREQIKSFMDKLAELPIKTVTRHNRLSVFRTVLNWCAEREFCQLLRFPKIPHGHYEKFIPPTPVELQAMLSAAPAHLQRIILVGSQLGIRVGPSEMFKLTWENVDFTLALIRVQAAHKNPAAPWREIPIRKSLLDLMREWFSEDNAKGIRHIIHYKGKPLASIKNSWSQMLKNAGIARRIRPYDLRHAFATELIAAGTDIGTVAKLMGHSSPNMIYQHYQFVLDKQKRAAVENLPDFTHVSRKMCPNKKEDTEIQ